MMRPIHNVVSGVKGLLWTPKKGGRLPSAPSLSPSVEPLRVSPASPLRSTIAGALHDWRGLLVVGLLVGLAVLL